MSVYSYTVCSSISSSRILETLKILLLVCIHSWYYKSVSARYHFARGKLENGMLKQSKNIWQPNKVVTERFENSYCPYSFSYFYNVTSHVLQTNVSFDNVGDDVFYFKQILILNTDQLTARIIHFNLSFISLLSRDDNFSSSMDSWIQQTSPCH